MTKQLTSQEQMFIFNVLEGTNIKIKDAQEALILMGKLDHNLSETIKKEQAAKAKKG